MVDEKLLVRKAKAGDNEAFNQLYELYKPYIQSISRKYYLIGGDSEDVFQVGLLGMYKAVMTYKEEEGASFKTFADLCIKSEIKTNIAKQKNQKNKPLNESVSVDGEKEDEDAWAFVLISDELSPEEELIKKQAIKKIVAELKRTLKPLQKRVLMLYLENKPYSEIATAISDDEKFLGKSQEQILKYVDNTLTQIKKKMLQFKEREDL